MEVGGEIGQYGIIVKTKRRGFGAVSIPGEYNTKERSRKKTNDKTTGSAGIRSLETFQGTNYQWNGGRTRL